MTILDLPTGPQEVVSTQDGKLPAPEGISEFLVGLEDGRLFIREDLRDDPEIDSYVDRFSRELATFGKGKKMALTRVKKDNFHWLLSKIRRETASTGRPVPEPVPASSSSAGVGEMDANRTDGTEALSPQGAGSPGTPLSEDVSREDDETGIPAQLQEKVVLLPDGRIAAAEELRENSSFDRFVRRHSLNLEACGKIGHFRILWMDSSELRNLREGPGEDIPDLLAEPDFDAEPEFPPGESPETGVPREPSPGEGMEAEKRETGPSLGPPEEERSGTTGTDRDLRKKGPDLPVPSSDPPEPAPECLSSPSGGTIPDFRAPDEIASMVLLDLSGRFYVSREHKTNQHVNYYCRHFVPELWPKIFGDKPVPKPQYIPYEHVRKIRLDTLPGERADAGYKAEGDEARKIMEILRDAIARRASDIHLRVERDRTRVLYRIHGWLKPVQTLTHDEGERLARIVYNTMLDSAGRDNMFSDKKPQDGQFRQDYLPRGVFNIREFHAPTGGTGLGTITMVLRLQYGSGTATAQVTDIDTLGYDAFHLAQLRFLMGLSHGIVLFAGPMGSGKSTSMAGVLSIVLSMHPLEEGRGVHLATLEDPPEYMIPTASQIAVPGGQFSSVRGRIMRFDANILMIGEIRDPETAEMAVEDAMSGHVVYSTVHANDVLSIPRRLDGLKVRRDLLCDPTIFRGMVCQRLLPILCPECKISWEEADRAGILRPDLSKRLAELSGERVKTVFFHRSGGCETCDGQGIVGRTIVAEILLPDQDILDMISGGRMTDAWRHFREKLDGRTMMDHALDKMRAGFVDPRDVEAKLGWIHQGLLDHRAVREIVGGFS